MPPELDGEGTDPSAMAAAATRCWRPGAATEALRPLLAELLRLGMRFPLEEELEGEVEESVYVMF